MQISFSPTLGDTVYANTLSHKSTVQLHFTATFPLADYEAYCQRGLKLELWSDMNDRYRWGARSFIECPQFSPRYPSALQFPLVPNSIDSMAGDIHTLSLSFSVPCTGQSQMAYTYRLVHPSGEVEWLGHAGNNGNVVLNNALSFYTGQWSPCADDDEAYIWSASGMSVDYLEVAKLNTKSECTFWAFSADG